MFKQLPTMISDLNKLGIINDILFLFSLLFSVDDEKIIGYLQKHYRYKLRHLNWCLFTLHYSFIFERM